MKTIKFLFTLILMVATLSLFAQNGGLTTDHFKVYGKCDKCKHRIEKAVKIDGVASADWNSATKMLEVSYNQAKISNAELQMELAASGHDTELYCASDAIYAELACCKYERKKMKKAQ
ncbi:MAG TPA: cation transporter [Chitinophagaceae bacterium]